MGAVVRAAGLLQEAARRAVRPTPCTYIFHPNLNALNPDARYVLPVAPFFPEASPSSYLF